MVSQVCVLAGNDPVLFSGIEKNNPLGLWRFLTCLIIWACGTPVQPLPIVLEGHKAEKPERVALCLICGDQGTAKLCDLELVCLCGYFQLN